MLLSQLPNQKFWGLLEYKPQWTLTLQGWLFLGFVLISVLISFVLCIHPFLRVSRPVEAEVMVIEGWVPDITIEGAIAQFQEKNYRLMITTGNEIGRGKYLSDYKTFADLAAATAIALGLNRDQVVSVPNKTVSVNRTAASAKAVKQWLLSSDLNIKAINIYSHDVHTRRSWLIFRTLLEPEIKVGAIAFSPAYSKSWWKTSTGIKSVIMETIAYFYTKLIWPMEN
ncbi:ElyC/SanA/YdcF family protein [Cyanothece sp. BG0011]|uniref:ElyC/SanA/YdcF family protein n=1 Tax=Cyanothece sp. BG0011 TaxID=2082950 RepID=UPI000D1EAD55|nr:ElyC/SanA/YdcF family protein [Cyanothece sp. BG0011]